MEIFFFLLFIGLIVLFSRSKFPELKYESLSQPAKRLYNTIYSGGIENHPRLTLEREIEYWIRSQPVNKMKQMRRYLLSEIQKLQPADWHGYMCNAILSRSTNLYYFLDDEGKTTIRFAKSREMAGIQDALQAVKTTPVEYPFTLRTFFHMMFCRIIMNTRLDDRYYTYGQLKVVNLLRSYQASVGLCEYFPEEETSSEWSRTPVFARLAMHFTWLAKQRRQNWIDINRGFPIIEFDLHRIDDVGIFKYEGSLLNCLFLHIASRMTRLADIEPQYRSFSESTYDMRAACFTRGPGEVCVVKYTGIDERFPHRLYVEFINIPPTDLLYRELLSMKLHLECNN